ncbi:2OG-Fe(II) oxygenase [Geminicoccaceae bacterium 1502E]|nr:2OG-Fe(II) oxygenase [Geminicoccaceae bacterium 1502E]
MMDVGASGRDGVAGGGCSRESREGSFGSLAGLTPGDPAPWFTGRTGSNPRYVFASAAGRWVVLCFLGSAAEPAAAAALRAVAARRRLFDDERACFFGVSADPEDEAQGRLRQSVPGIRYFFDRDGAIGRLYGAVREGEPFRPLWLVLDPMLRVVAVLPLAQAEAALRLVEALPPPAAHAGVEQVAPVLILPRVLEPALCRHLIGLYERHGGRESGFMREIEGRTVLVSDPAHKRRADHAIEDAATRRALRERIVRRLLPEIHKAFQFQATRMERYIVSCYDSAEGGHFRPHRDNTTKGTAHRRFAVSINLNAEEYEGGDLRFPEFGPRCYRPPTGGAVVFSCSLLHEATPVSVGRRYAFLPFLYDEAGARQREAGRASLGEAAPAG